MSYHKRGSSGYLVVRRKGNSPIRVVAGERFRTKKKAEKEVREWKKAYRGSDVKFMVREKTWRKKTLALARMPVPKSCGYDVL